MAWDYYLNLEPIALKTARDAVEKMSVTNISQLHSDYYDETIFYENLQYGYTVVVMSVSYLESAVNTIMRHICGYEPLSKEIRFSVADKLDLIMDTHKEEWAKIKASHCWQQYRELEQVRNGLIHYKANKSDFMGSAPPLGGWQIGKQTFGEFFTKPCIESHLNGVVKLLEEITDILELQIADGFSPLIAGASGLPTDYIYHARELPEDAESLNRMTSTSSKWHLLHPIISKKENREQIQPHETSAYKFNFISRLIAWFQAPSMH